MRNVFDQYQQPENRLTHALLCSLDADRKLLSSFIKWATGRLRSADDLEVREQSLPGERDELPEEEAERRGIPDGCISDDDGWALLIESKLTVQWSPDQLRRHRRSASRHGLTDVTILCITAGRSTQPVPEGCTARCWADVYAWLVQQAARSDWAGRCRQYFDALEARLMSSGRPFEGAITMFTGIPFSEDVPYTYAQAKRLLGLLRIALLSDGALVQALALDAHHAGRGAITGTKARKVWDFIAFAQARGSNSFTSFPHLTLGVLDDRLEAMFTLPNGVPTTRRRAVLGADAAAFAQRVGAFVREFDRVWALEPASRPVVNVVQRHYASQRSEPVYDAVLRFDPRTAFPVEGSGSVKKQPEWLQTAHEVLDRRTSNVQFQIGVEFEYARCELVKKPAIVPAVAATWMACRPFIL